MLDYGKKVFRIDKVRATEMFKALTLAAMSAPELSNAIQCIKNRDTETVIKNIKKLNIKNKTKILAFLKDVRKIQQYRLSNTDTEVQFRNCLHEFKELKTRALQALTSRVEGKEKTWNKYSLNVNDFRYGIVDFLSWKPNDSEKHAAIKFLKKTQRFLAKDRTLSDGEGISIVKYNFYFIDHTRKAAILQKFCYYRKKKKNAYPTVNKTYYLVYVKDGRIELKKITPGAVRSIVHHDNMKKLEDLMS